MRVGIGALLAPTGGPARYATELVLALDGIASGEEYVVFTNRPDAFVATKSVRVVPVPLPSPLLEPLWDHLLLPAAARRWELDVYHGVKGALPFALATRRVVTIHDLAVYACPETFAWQQHLHMRPNLRLAARRAHRIVADSEHARQDIARRLHVPLRTVVAVPLGVRTDLFSPEPALEDDQIAARLALPERFLLYAGTIQPRKNIDLVVAAFAPLAASGQWSLLLAGRPRPGYRPAWLTAPPPGVRYLGVLSDRELATVYRRAAALISPSSYEGFGLTLLEAMASGCPVVGAANTSVPEVVGDAGILLERIDAEAIGTAMEHLISNRAARRDLGCRGRERARTFTWADTARRMRSVYEEVVGHG